MTKFWSHSVFVVWLNFLLQVWSITNGAYVHVHVYVCVCVCSIINLSKSLFSNKWQIRPRHSLSLAGLVVVIIVVVLDSICLWTFALPPITPIAIDRKWLSACEFAFQFVGHCGRMTIESKGEWANAFVHWMSGISVIWCRWWWWLMLLMMMMVMVMIMWIKGKKAIFWSMGQHASQVSSTIQPSSHSFWSVSCGSVSAMSIIQMGMDWIASVQWMLTACLPAWLDG